MNLLHVFSTSDPNVARWLLDLGLTVPPHAGRQPTRADVRRAIEGLPEAIVETVDRAGTEATLINAYGVCASVYVRDADSLSPASVHFERYPRELVAPIVESLVESCGPLVLFGGHEPVIATSERDSIAAIRAGQY